MKINIRGQDLALHQAIFSFLKFEIQKPDYTNKETFRQTIEHYDHVSIATQKIITWKIQNITKSGITRGKRSCHMKSRSWFN